MSLEDSLPLSAPRAGALVGSVVVVWIVMGSPLAALDHRWLTAHMAQHLLLTTVAAPLILWSTQSVADHLPALDRLAHPLVCWLAGTATVIAWHVPFLFQLGMQSATWHNFENASFLVSGLLFWWPVMHAPSDFTRWNIPVYLFLATLPCDALSAFLAFCDHVLYSHYVHHSSTISALRDQATAGALMWIWVTFAYLIPAAMVTFQALSPQRRAPVEEIL